MGLTERGVNGDPARQQRLLRRARVLAQLLDSQFRIPGTSIRFGLDPIIGLVPGLGDFVSLLLSGAILWMAYLAGAGPALLGRMTINVLFDMLAGSIPVVGDLFDVAFKANLMNLDLFERHCSSQSKP